MSSRKGFNFYRYWVDAFVTHTNRSTEFRTKLLDVDAATKRSFNTSVFLIKQQFGYEAEDLEALVDFMYLHDPMQLKADKARYGNVAVLREAAPYFERWRRATVDLIADVGLRRAVHDTIPSADDAEYIASVMEMYK